MHLFHVHRTLISRSCRIEASVIGVAGQRLLFMQSMPPKEGSAGGTRPRKLEVDLKNANNRVAALEAADPHGRRRPGRTLADGARDIVQDLSDGKPVTPDDILRATQPLIRDLSPLFERMRAKQIERMSNSKMGELARKYSLDAHAAGRTTKMV